MDHDPTKKIKFIKVIEKLKGLPNLEIKNLARTRWIASIWATVHVESMYTFYNIPAKTIFNDKDACILKDYAEEVYLQCKRIVRMVEFEEFKIHI